MAKSFDLVSRKVEKVKTKNREIKTEIPVLGSLETVKELRRYAG